jgi:hypothetical protein
MKSEAAGHLLLFVDDLIACDRLCLVSSFLNMRGATAAVPEPPYQTLFAARRSNVKYPKSANRR